jgi:hypothetical protein
MSKVVFLKYLKYDNSKCVNPFPYEGESWWLIKSIHYKRFLKLMNNDSIKDKDFINPKNWKIVKGEDMKGSEIYSLDYRLINEYVMGESDVIPKLTPFNPKLHCSEWKPNDMSYLGFSKYEIESVGAPYWHMNPTYQVLVRK